MHLFQSRRPGQSLVEVVIAICVFVVIAGSVLPLLYRSVSVTEEARERMFAAYAAQEGMEAVRSIVNRSGYGALSNGTYGLSESTGYYTFDSAPEAMSGGISRSIVISDAYRDAAGNVYGETAAGRTIDSNAHFVAVTGQWSPPGSTRVLSVTLSTFFTAWRP